jgi:hypothetical protein
MHRKRFSWVALVGIGLAGVVAVSAAASTLAARSPASPLEIVFHGRHEPMPPNPFATVLHVGTFTSGAPFCVSGTAEDAGWDRLRPNSDTSGLRLYTCADGSGSLTLWITSLQAEHTPGAGSEWRIEQGSRRYEGLRGKGPPRRGAVLQPRGLSDDHVEGIRGCGRHRAEPRLHERAERDEAAPPCWRLFDPSRFLASG